MKIKGNKFVVTGGAGLIGSHIVDHLLHLGASQVVIIDNLTRGSLDNLSAALQDARATLIKADICIYDAISKHFENAEGCFHLAALRITQCASEPKAALDSMVSGTFNVIQACLEHKVEKIVFSSSASVYGMAEKFPTDEKHHPWNNDTFYGAAKAFGEGMLRAFKSTHGLDFVALRYFNVYGPRMDAHGKYTEVLIRWMECIERGDTPKIFGDGQQTMDFIYADDVAHANVLAMQAEVSDIALNIASGTEVSLRGLLDELAVVCGISSLEPEYLPERKVNPVPRRLADVRSAYQHIGFKARTSLNAGLTELVEWYRKIMLPKKMAS
jgi:UDP-glucose 4-epimerase